MVRGLALFSLTSLLLGLGNGQRVGESKEVHPKLTTYRCSKKGGCKAQTNYVVLDSLAHPIHQATNSYNCGDWGNKPNATACPNQELCAKNCVMEGIPNYSAYGVTTKGSSLRLQQLINGNLVSPRVYLLDKTERKYEMMQLTGNEISFEIDASKLPCGMNSALYLSEMEAAGGQSKLNPGGAFYGTGYCDAQCFVTPFINGVGNVQGRGACCNEMDIWEANARSTSIAPHTCSKKGVYLCQGAECEQEGGVCDKIGCAWNPYRNKAPNSYGNSAKFKVDTTRPFDVVTQFHADRRGKLNRIYRLYVQGGKVIQTQTVNVPGLPKTDALNDDFCKATGSSRYLELGGTAGMGDALSRGMVLAMSIWWDEGGNMNWLDSGDAGPCRADEGSPANIQLVQPKPEVTFSNMRWGEIGSTFAKN